MELLNPANISNDTLYNAFIYIKLLCKHSLFSTFTSIKASNLTNFFPVQNISTIILHLLRSSSPAAIFRRINSIIVYSVYGVFIGGSAANIINEIKIRNSPRLAHNYPTSTITMIKSIVLVIASVFDFTPGSIFFGLLPVIPTSFTMAFSHDPIIAYSFLEVAFPSLL